MLGSVSGDRGWVEKSLMNQLLPPVSILAATGLLLSVIVHIYAFLGQQVPFGNLAYGLHVGLFIVWFPAASVGKLLSKDFKQSELFQAMLRGCPIWMKRMPYLFFLYGAINMIWIISTGQATKCGDIGNEIQQYRLFSGFWMVFYSAAFSVLYSASQTEILDKERRCRNGHVVSPSARFCEDCGAPVPDWRN